MNTIEYANFKHVNPEDFFQVLNEQPLRKPLMDHVQFDSVSIKKWMDGKIQAESIPGCRVRAVLIDGVLAGWCGIQPYDNGFEIAIIISKPFRGFGISLFKTLMRWAKEFGHTEIMFHLLETRPEYRFLKRKASKVQKTTLLGRSFTTYVISVVEWNKQGNAQVIVIFSGLPNLSSPLRDVETFRFSWHEITTQPGDSITVTHTMKDRIMNSSTRYCITANNQMYNKNMRPCFLALR